MSDTSSQWGGNGGSFEPPADDPAVDPAVNEDGSVGDAPEGATPENSGLAAPDDPYIGVSDEYKNYASDTAKPLLSDDEDQRAEEEAAMEREAAVAEQSTLIGPLGYTNRTPDEGSAPADEGK